MSYARAGSEVSRGRDTRHRARLPRTERDAFCLLAGCVLAAYLLPAGAQAPVSEAPALPPDSTAQQPAILAHEERAAFVLPDIVVRGEDLSRLRGGVRLLETAVPEIEASEAPALVSPGATRYQARRRHPFELRLPPLVPSDVPAGWIQLTAEQGPGGALRAMLRPRREQLLWVGAEAWNERIDARRHRAVRVGWRRAGGGRAAGTRLGCDVALRRESWDADWGGGGRGGRMNELCGAFGLERGLRLAGEETVLGGRLAAAAVRNELDRQAGAAGEPTRDGRWVTLSLTLHRASCLCDLRPLVLAGETDTRRLVVDLEAGVTQRENPAAAPVGRGRWDARAGLRWAGRGWQLLLGAAGAGEGSAEPLFGPWLDLRRLSARGWLAALRVRPAQLAAEGVRPGEIPLGTHDLFGADPPARAPAGGPIIRVPDLPPPRAWPAMEVGVRRAGARLTLEASVAVARLHDPVGIRADSLGDRFLYATATRSTGDWASAVALELTRRLGAHTALRARYEGWFDGGEEEEIVLGVPRHRLTLRLETVRGRWRLALLGNLRDELPAGSAADPVAASAAVDVYAAWRAEWGEVGVRVANLLAEPVAALPNDVSDATLVTIEWNLPWSARLP